MRNDLKIVVKSGDSQAFRYDVREVIREKVVGSNRLLDEHLVVFFLITEYFVDCKNVSFLSHATLISSANSLVTQLTQVSTIAQLIFQRIAEDVFLVVFLRAIKKLLMKGTKVN